MCVGPANEGDGGKGPDGSSGGSGREQQPGNAGGVGRRGFLQDFARDSAAVRPRPGWASAMFAQHILARGIEKSRFRGLEGPGEYTILIGALIDLHTSAFRDEDASRGRWRQGQVLCHCDRSQCQQGERPEFIYRLHT